MKKNLIFHTTAVTKSQTAKRYYIDNDFIYDLEVKAENWNEAFEIYRQEMDEENCILISKNAVKARKVVSTGKDKVEFSMIGRYPFSEKDGSVTCKYVDLTVTVYTNVDVWTVHPKKYSKG